MIFKNEISRTEFRCTKVPLLDEDDRREAELEEKICSLDQKFGESELDSPPRPLNVLGFVFVCEKLSEMDGYPRLIPPSRLKSSLKKSSTTSRIAREKLKIRLDTSELHDVSLASDPRNGKFYRKDKPCNDQGCLGGFCLPEYRENNEIKKK
ncbi:hypothetical protein KM043_018273 [Ampulex compressa]|nr:hypothetical protein KM043_018273 [Ampulex compressa]